MTNSVFATDLELGDGLKVTSIRLFNVNWENKGSTVTHLVTMTINSRLQLRDWQLRKIHSNNSLMLLPPSRNYKDKEDKWQTSYHVLLPQPDRDRIISTIVDRISGQQSRSA